MHDNFDWTYNRGPRQGIPQFDLTTITTPYGLLPKEVRRALKAHGGAIEFYDPWRGEGEWDCVDRPLWCRDVVYRVRPEPPKPVVKDVTMEIVVNGTRTKTTWTFVDGQMTPVAAVEVLK